MKKVQKILSKHDAIAESWSFKHQTITNFGGKIFTSLENISQIWIFLMILPYRSAMQCLRPKSAKTCFLKKFTHTLPKIAKQNQKRPNLVKSCWYPTRDSKGMAIATLKKSLTAEKKGSEKNFLKILNFFQGVWLGNVIFSA